MARSSPLPNDKLLLHGSVLGPCTADTCLHSPGLRLGAEPALLDDKPSISAGLVSVCKFPMVVGTVNLFTTIGKGFANFHLCARWMLYNIMTSCYGLSLNLCLFWYKQPGYGFCLK